MLVPKNGLLPLFYHYPRYLVQNLQNQRDLTAHRRLKTVISNLNTRAYHSSTWIISAQYYSYEYYLQTNNTGTGYPSEGRISSAAIR